ncbi:hypothetical protein KR044_012020 [Drosophila immigrans]|nr:hypothetical protein KR044_012020 [Drosophila immigrans]
MAFLCTDVPQSVYTRRQSSDVFQNDPFKIQSFNFHYAERPAYPVQHFQRPSPISAESTPFKTFFYNAKFHRNAESPPTSSFVENRRRQFLHDFSRVSPPVTREIFSVLKPQERHSRYPVASIPPVAANPPPLLRTCCNREDYRAMDRGHSVTTIRRTRSTSLNWKAPAKQPSESSIRQSPRRTASSCSGCTININIRSTDSEVVVDKALKIKIEASNTDKSQGVALRRCCSSNSFVIDKRLSKFSVSNGCQQDELLAKRLQLQAERERMEKQRQQELRVDRERVRQREQERERLRKAERERDLERLRQLQTEREFQRLRELERETQRRRELEKAERMRREAPQQKQQQRQPMRAKSLTDPITAPVVMTSHLCPRASSDRLPGMAPCYLRPSEPTRAERLQICSRNLSRLQKICGKPAEATAPKSLERRSSGVSNFNTIVRDSGSNSSLRNERKLLNVQVNGQPVSSSVPIHTRINNMPIRITTSQPQDKHLRLSFNRVRAAGGATSEESPPAPPCNVNINVYADNPRSKRL